MDITKTLKIVEGALNDLVQDVREETAREIEARIRDGVSMLAGTLSRSSLVKGKPGRKPGRKPKAVAKTPRKASPGRKIQGRYMGMLRRFKGRVNQQIKKLAREEGFAAAIAQMEKLNKGNGVAPKPKAVKAVTPAKVQPKPAKGAIVVKVKKGGDTAHLAAAVATAAKETPAPAQGA